MQEKKNYTLADFTPEEVKAFNTELEALLKKHTGEIVVTPIINQNGTIGAKVEVFKKVELVPKAEGVPFNVEALNNGENANEPIEHKDETPETNQEA